MKYNIISKYRTEIIVYSGTSRELCHGLGPRATEGHAPSAFTQYHRLTR